MPLVYKALAKKPGQCVYAHCNKPGNKIYEIRDPRYRILACSKEHAYMAELRLAELHEVLSEIEHYRRIKILDSLEIMGFKLRHEP